MIWTILKGIVIGLIVSAPMGPTGILCVRRTLTKGQKSGLYTGLGASVSDVLYAMITLLGVSSFIDFINFHSAEIQLGGSLFMIAFAVYLIYSDPMVYDHQKRKKKTVGQSSEEAAEFKELLKKDFSSGFIITISNPLIVFLFIGLFAQFSFLNGVEDNYFLLLAGLLSIAAGAILWWLFVTHFVIKLKEWFNIQSIKILNRSIGTVLLALGVIGVLVASFDLV